MISDSNGYQDEDFLVQNVADVFASLFEYVKT